MNSAGQILQDCKVASPANENLGTVRFPRVVLGFPSGDTGFPAFWQCWREKVPQDAEKVN